jgi:integrase
MKPGTVVKEISVLKHCLKLAVEWGDLNQNAAAGARLPKLPQGRTRYLTPGELKAALEAAPDWLRGPMAFAACTGVRRGEMLALRWMDVDVKNRRLYLRETKNGNLRILPLPLRFSPSTPSAYLSASGFQTLAFTRYATPPRVGSCKRERTCMQSARFSATRRRA